MSFTGTQQKCKVCDKTVHLVDTLSADGNVFHKNCFRCNQCNGLLAVCIHTYLNLFSGFTNLFLLYGPSFMFYIYQRWVKLHLKTCIFYFIFYETQNDRDYTM